MNAQHESGSTTMNYIVNWYLSVTDHKDFPLLVELSFSELETMVLQLNNKDQVIYVNNVLPEGRLLIWGKDEANISLELQYSAHWYDRDIPKTEFKDYMTNIHDIATRPEDYGFNFGE
jgi:hypothetical protein